MKASRVEQSRPVSTMEGGFSLTFERSRSMSLDFLNAALGCLFLGVWIIVGHIIAVDYF